MKLIFALAATLLASAAALAQDGPALSEARTREAERRISPVAAQANLTATQKEQVVLTLAGAAEMMDAIRKAHASDQATRETLLGRVRESTDAELRRIMKPYQYQRYLEIERTGRQERLQAFSPWLFPIRPAAAGC